MSNEFKNYLFEYRYNGERYGFQIQARSPEEAKQRIRCIGSNASYDGEVFLVINTTRLNFLGWISRLFSSN